MMERQEFDILTSEIRGTLVAVAGRFLRAAGIADTAEDIAQEAMLTLWGLLQQDYPVREPKALAIKITKNICIARYRKGRVETVSLSGLDLPGGLAATQTVEEKEITALRDKLYSSLTDTQRRYLCLRNDYGLSLDEIADLTGKPKTSIKTTLSAARKQLLEQLKHTI